MLEINELVKRYPGEDRNAINGITMQISRGEFFGLLGPNGAGKTTLIGMISTLLLPTKGEILLDGQCLCRDNLRAKQQLSLVTQHYSIRNDMTVWQIMELQARLYGISTREWKPRAEELLAFCGLSGEIKQTTRKLSGGMKRKLMLARALLTKPSFLILDEPTVGLDPTSRRQIWDLLRTLNQHGLTVLLTTHYMDEAQTLCERVGILSLGSLTKTDTPDNMIYQLGRFAVDIFDGKQTTNRYFSEREQALTFVATTDYKTTLRSTTLEDVFLNETGYNLGDAI